VAPNSSAESTEGDDYTRRLQAKADVWWKRLLPTQAPYRWNLRRLNLGRTLDIGCGVGRNLAHLGASGIGVDHNSSSVQACRDRGLEAYTVEDFFASGRARPHSFDSGLVAHVLEHIAESEAHEVMYRYLPFVRDGGRLVFITPQERGFASDETHVRFIGFAESADFARALGLGVELQYSFPLPRAAGRAFTYNEFVTVARKGNKA
jgi:SAM-dependent methyltransferase